MIPRWRRLVYQSLAIIFFTLLIVFAIINALRFAEPSPADAVTCMVFSVVGVFTALAYGTYLKRLPNSAFAWFTPLTNATLYRRYFWRKLPFVVLVFLVVPLVLAVGVAQDDASAQSFTSAFLIFLLTAVTVTMSALTGIGQEPGWFMRWVTPFFYLVYRLAQSISFMVVLLIIGGVIFFYREAITETGILVVGVADFLRQIPVIGVILSFLFCPLLEIGHLYSAPVASQLDQWILVFFLAGTAAVHVPLVLRVIRQNEPEWRSAEEWAADPLKDDADVAPETAYPQEPADDSGSAAGGRKPSPVVEKITAEVRGWFTPTPGSKLSESHLYIMFVVFLALSFFHSVSIHEMGQKAIAFWIFFFVLVMPAARFSRKAASVTWWPAARTAVIEDAFVGSRVTWVFFFICMVIGFGYYGWDLAHLVWLVPAVLYGRIGVPAFGVFVQHAVLGRKEMVWLQSIILIIATIAAIVFLAKYLLMIDSAAPLGTLYLVLCSVSILIPVITAALGLHYESRHTGKQFYSAVK